MSSYYYSPYSHSFYHHHCSCWISYLSQMIFLLGAIKGWLLILSFFELILSLFYCMFDIVQLLFGTVKRDQKQVCTNYFHDFANTFPASSTNDSVLTKADLSTKIGIQCFIFGPHSHLNYFIYPKLDLTNFYSLLQVILFRF